MFQLSISRQGMIRFERSLTGPLELGRQDENRGEPAPYELVASTSPMRLIIAPSSETRISRRHAMIVPHINSEIEVSNPSAQSALFCGPEHSTPELLSPGQKRRLIAPAVITFPDETRVLVQDESQALNELSHRTIAPGNLVEEQEQAFDPSSSQGETAEALLRIVQGLADGFQLRTRRAEIDQFAAQQMIQLLGLDVSFVIAKVGDAWQETASNRSAQRHADCRPNEAVLAEVALQKRTLWRTTGGDPRITLSGVSTILAAPILAADGEVRGAVYGEKFRAVFTESAAGDRARAQLVEFVATGLAAAYVRLEKLQEASRRKILFEQFFTRELADELDRSPDLLDGRDAEVSVLFCDLRGFSSVCEALGTSKTFAWIQDVMTELSECVALENGVLLDYIGDEVIAMWGAPQSDPDHAARAVRAGLRMLAALPEMNERWILELGKPFSLGIGVNSGPVRVGNMGSIRKFKYGPLGNTVNLASRIQGLNKQLGTRFLISGSTMALLKDDHALRRIGSIRVVNIEEPAMIFEVPELNTPAWSQLRECYENALKHFEERDFSAVLPLISRGLTVVPKDKPSVILLSRAVQALANGPTAAHPIWLVDEK